MLQWKHFCLTTVKQSTSPRGVWLQRQSSKIASWSPVQVHVWHDVGFLKAVDTYPSADIDRYLTVCDVWR